jgi:hypothetical protein
MDKSDTISGNGVSAAIRRTLAIAREVAGTATIMRSDYYPSGPDGEPDGLRVFTVMEVAAKVDNPANRRKGVVGEPYLKVHKHTPDGWPVFEVEYERDADGRRVKVDGEPVPVLDENGEPVLARDVDGNLIPATRNYKPENIGADTFRPVA